ncbi:MAG TPA: tetratricopeptide repeat protein [Bdellovibrionales bacterium]|nr:tetratricopeptide repeat protein [Bdellovibrionales bacterium]
MISGQTELSDLLETAREHFREGNYKIAESLLQQVMLKDGRNPEVFHMLATIYYDQGKFNKAIRTFRRSLEIDPAFTDASVGLSIILNDLGRYEEGKQVFVEAQKALARKSTAADPYMQEKLASKHDELGEMYFQYKRYGEAAEQYEKALTLSSRKADLKMKLIECWIQEGDSARAAKELRALSHEYPSFIPARLKLGILLYNAKRVTEAVEQWEAVLLRDPEHPTALKYLQMAQQSGSTLLA